MCGPLRCHTVAAGATAITDYKEGDPTNPKGAGERLLLRRRRLGVLVCIAALCVNPVLAVGIAQGTQTATEASCAAPAGVVRDWVGAWKAKNFKRMNQLSEVSWRLRTRGPVQTLRDQYGFKDVLSYRFVRCAVLSGVSARVTFRVKYRTFKVSHVQIRAMVIREDKSGHVSAVGRWGVNPISTLREDPVR
jgi:hypothetical protein